MDDATVISTTLFTTDDDDCSNWSELHEDMIHMIFKKFTSVADCIRFGSVCVSWRSIPFAFVHPDLLHPQLPLLMIPTPPPSPPQNNNKEEVETRSFYVLSKKSVYKDIKILLPYNRNCRGSSHGWIITSAQQEYTGYYSVEMFNPFISLINKNNNNDQYHHHPKIQLPPLITIFKQDMQQAYNFRSREYLYKAIVSVNPSSHPRDYVVMIIYGRNTKLGFWRPGDEVWTDIDFGLAGCLFDDVIYHKGLFYVVNQVGDVMVVDMNNGIGSPSVRRLVIVAPRTHEQRPPISLKKYLVESAGDLLLVDKGRFSTRDNSDMVFKVSKLISEKGTYKWEALNTLPGRMLFVGDNASISVAVADFPEGKSSCIYFTHDEADIFKKGYYIHNGIFNMEEDKTIERLRPMAGDYISPINTIWVEPSNIEMLFSFIQSDRRI